MKATAILTATASLGLLMAGPSCSTTSSMQPIRYLEGIAPMSPQGHQNPLYADAYWDGDGVQGDPRIVIDLSEQKSYFYKSGVLVGVTPISSGNEKYRTPTGTYRVTEKSPNHRSSAYGDFVDAYGNVVVRDVDSRKDRAPAGTSFLGASMPYFLRFNKGIGMHAGFLPGYPASHGCVRMPDHIARSFYEHAPHGTPVEVVP